MSSPKSHTSLLLRISGRVQGVGFRYTIRTIANQTGITGWVRNLPDGAVEALIQGDDAALAAMKAWCREGPAFARVDQVQETLRTGEAAHESFAIRG